MWKFASKEMMSCVSRINVDRKSVDSQNRCTNGNGSGLPSVNRTGLILSPDKEAQATSMFEGAASSLSSVVIYLVVVIVVIVDYFVNRVGVSRIVSGGCSRQQVCRTCHRAGREAGR